MNVTLYWVLYLLLCMHNSDNKILSYIIPNIGVISVLDMSSHDADGTQGGGVCPMFSYQSPPPNPVLIGDNSVVSF